jgi:hypothetical protein
LCLAFGFDIRCCLLYITIITIIIHYYYYTLLLLYIIISSIISSFLFSSSVLSSVLFSSSVYIILFFSSILLTSSDLSSFTIILPLIPIPLSSHPNIHSILVGTWIRLFIFSSDLSNIPNIWPRTNYRRDVSSGVGLKYVESCLSWWMVLVWH